MSSALVTGAAGFIGRRVVAAARAEGWDVIALGRRPQPGITVAMDLTKPVRDMPAVDTVFHLAGGYVGLSLKELERLDLEIARNLIAWGVKSGVHQWIFASAAEVYGHCSEPADEDRVPSPVIPYGRVKPRIEGLFEQLYRQVPESRVVALRVGEVYGRDGTLIRELARRLRGGFCPWFGSGKVPVSFVHVEDIARSFMAATEGWRPGFLVVNVADDRPALWSDFVNHLAKRVGARSPVALPLPLAHVYAAVNEAVDRARGREPTITRRIVQLLTTSKPLSNTRLRTRLGVDLLHPDYRHGLAEVLDDEAV